MTTTPMKSAFALSCCMSILSMTAACEGNKGDKDENTTTNKEMQRGTEAEQKDSTGKPGSMGGQGGQAGQPGHPGSPTSGGADDMKVERPTDRVGDVRDQMGTDTRTPLERASDRLTELEDRITRAKDDAKAKSRQINADADRELTEARAKVKAKAEAAKQATAETTSKAIQEFEEALDDLDKKLKAYEGS